MNRIVLYGSCVLISLLLVEIASAVVPKGGARPGNIPRPAPSLGNVRPNPQPMPRPTPPQIARPTPQPRPSIVPSRPNVPNVSRPTMPNIPRPNVPNVNRPTMPNVPRPSLPNVNRPNMPNVTRPNPPNINRPNVPNITTRPNLPNLGGNLPNMGGNRPSPPNINTRPNLPNLGSNRPNLPNLGGNRPNLPNIGSNKPPLISNRPSPGDNRPGLGNRPGISTLPSFPNLGDNRPKPGGILGNGNRPGGIGGDRPPIARPLPGTPNRPKPGDILGKIDRPKIDIGNRPKIDIGNRPKIDIGNRPKIDIGNRPKIDIGNRPKIDIGIGGDTIINNNIFNQNNNYFNQNNYNFYNNAGKWWPNRGYYWHNYHRYYGDWYTGSWCGWNSYPSFWAGTGLGWLAATATPFVYSNPYYVAPTIVQQEFNYSVPLPIATQEPTTIIIDNTTQAPPQASPSLSNTPTLSSSEPAEPAEDPKMKEAGTYFDTARAAFQRGDYGKAQSEVEKAIKLLPGDALLHEFRSLTLFAQKKYNEAASAIYAVLASGPGWNWDTLKSFYPEVDVYSKQLRDLEEHAKANPKAADDRFLLAYHYLTLEENEAAIQILDLVVKLMPKDQLAIELKNALTAKPKDEPEEKTKDGR